MVRQSQRGGGEAKREEVILWSLLDFSSTMGVDSLSAVFASHPLTAFSGGLSHGDGRQCIVPHARSRCRLIESLGLTALVDRAVFC